MDIVIFTEVPFRAVLPNNKVSFTVQTTLQVFRVFALKQKSWVVPRRKNKRFAFVPFFGDEGYFYF
jgi:hypothetical protein